MAWPGWSDEDTLLLALDEVPPCEPVRIAGRVFAPKDELHATLVGRALGRELATVLGSRREAATRPAFESLDWTPRRTGRGALIERRARRDDGGHGPVASIIEFVDLPALPHWYRWLESLLGRQLALPPAHVTLYTCGRAHGIGIPTRRALRSREKARFDIATLQADGAGLTG